MLGLGSIAHMGSTGDMPMAFEPISLHQQPDATVAAGPHASGKQDA
jgi:hypothetical protein